MDIIHNNRPEVNIKFKVKLDMPKKISFLPLLKSAFFKLFFKIFSI